MSLRRRFTVLAAAVVAVTVLVVGGGLYAVFAHQQQSQLDDRLRGVAARSRSFERSGAGVIRVIGRPTADAVFALVLGPDGTASSHSANVDQLSLDLPASVRGAAAGGTDQLLTVSSGGQDYRVLLTSAPPLRLAPGVIPVPESAGAVAAAALGAAVSGSSVPAVPAGDATASPAGSVLVLGQSTQSIDDALRPLRYMLAGAAGISLLLGALGGWLVARRALQPVSRLSWAVDRIGHGGDLARRLPMPNSRDEVATLTENFNASLNRIEGAYRELETALDRQRRFVADASHELRTPLTTLRSDVELLRRHPGMPAADRAALVERSLTEVERMARLAADLLTLARGDAGAVAIGPVSWDAVTQRAVEDVVRICAPRHVSVELARLGEGAVDVDGLARVVRVLAENVARHTPRDAAVTVTAARDGADVVLSVADSGPGVDAALLPHVFDRFVRGDPARSGPGTGLGLAIAQGLVDAHGGRISAVPVVPHGLRVDVRLPARFTGVITAHPAPAPAGPPAITGTAPVLS